MSLTAYHESGHAVMAYHVGGAVARITIEPEAGSGRYGDTQVVWNFDWQASKQGRQQAAMVALAGPAAEMIHRQEPYHPGLLAEWADDWRQASAALQPLLPNDRMRVQTLEQITRLVLAYLYQDPIWAAVAALADEVEAHETLEQEMVEAVLEQWLD